jgi:hypothetical protein
MGRGRRDPCKGAGRPIGAGCPFRVRKESGTSRHHRHGVRAAFGRNDARISAGPNRAARFGEAWCEASYQPAIDVVQKQRRPRRHVDEPAPLRGEISLASEGRHQFGSEGQGLASPPRQSLELVREVPPVVVARASQAEIVAALGALQAQAPVLIEEWQRRVAGNGHGEP